MIKKEYRNIGETIYHFRLSNGLEIRVIPKAGFSSYYASFSANYGGAMRTFDFEGKRLDTPAGIAHFLEHKMFDLPNGDNALTILSSQGADPNAFTSQSMTCYYFKCTEDFESNLRLLLHFVSTPYFTPESVAKEQGIIGQEIMMCEDQPGVVIYYNLLNLLYDHHPIRDRVSGTIESISQIDDQTLYSCHKVFYSPSNMVLCVEGDVDPERISAIAEEELCGECSPIPKAYFGEPETLYPVCQRQSVRMAVSAPQFLFGLKVDPDSSLKDRLTSSLALRLLLGSSSPFYLRLYNSGLLNRDFDYDIDFSVQTGTVYIGGESKEPEKVYDELLGEIERIGKEGFDEAFFNRTLRSTIGGRLRSLEDFEDVCINMTSAYFDGFDFFDSFELLSSITRKDCEDWVRDNLKEDRFAVSLVTPV